MQEFLVIIKHKIKRIRIKINIEKTNSLFSKCIVQDTRKPTL